MGFCLWQRNWSWVTMADTSCPITVHRSLMPKMGKYCSNGVLTPKCCLIWRRKPVKTDLQSLLTPKTEWLLIRQIMNTFFRKHSSIGWSWLKNPNFRLPLILLLPNVCWSVMTKRRLSDWKNIGKNVWTERSMYSGRNPISWKSCHVALTNQLRWEPCFPIWISLRKKSLLSVMAFAMFPWSSLPDWVSPWAMLRIR